VFRIDDGVPILLPGPVTEAEKVQHAHQRNYYDAESRTLHTRQLDNWQRVYIDRVQQIWPDEPGAAPFLDVGAGADAYVVLEAAHRGLFSVGCDISVEAMKRAKRRADEQGLGDRCLFVVCLSERLPFADSTFGAVATIATLEHVPNDAIAISELARVTRPQARAFVAVPNSLDCAPMALRPVYSWHDKRVGHLRHYSIDDLASRFAKAGMAVTSHAYSAHWSKVWQLLVHVAATNMRIDDGRLWWWFEHLDRNASARDSGLHLNVWLKRDG
jgi:ubiquinone/menaquinone biosynthesis C-methylase UbiE